MLMILNNPLFGYWPVLLSTSVLKDRDIDLTNQMCITKVENSSYWAKMQIGKSRHWELNPYPPFPTSVIHGSPQLTGRGTELLCNRPTVLHLELIWVTPKIVRSWGDISVLLVLWESCWGLSRVQSCKLRLSVFSSGHIWVVRVEL